MKRKKYVFGRMWHARMAMWFAKDECDRVLVKAVIGLIVNLLYVFYNGILGVVLKSAIFAVSAVYYLLLSVMRFSVVLSAVKRKCAKEARAVGGIGGMMIVLSVVYGSVIFVSLKYEAAAVYGTIPMITIATFTFGKIISAAVSALRYREQRSDFIRSLQRIRYSEIAVSVLIMQRSMLVSFGDGDAPMTLIFNACTGAGICTFIFALGILTLTQHRKEIT